MKLQKILTTHFNCPKHFLNNAALTCQISSIGSLTQNWVENEFLVSCNASNNKTTEETSPKVEVIWPSIDFVKDSIDGWKAGNSLCFPKKNYRDFLNAYFCQYVPQQSGRSKIPPHIKTFTKRVDDDLAWVCLTSSNLSQAAWGALQKKGTQIMIRNYEIGVLFLPDFDNNKTYKAAELPLVAERTIHFPIPNRIPPPRYDLQVETPWYWGASRTPKANTKNDLTRVILRLQDYFGTVLLLTKQKEL